MRVSYGAVCIRKSASLPDEIAWVTRFIFDEEIEP